MVLDELICKYNAHQPHAKQVMTLSIRLFEELKRLEFHNMSDKKREFLQIGACLHDIGYSIEAEGHNKHSAELIKKESLIDFDKEDKKLIACIARYHRGSLPRRGHGDFASLSEKKQKKAMKLAGIVRLADALDRMHLGLVKDVELSYEENNNILWIKVIPEESGINLDLSAAQRKKDLLEKAFGVQAVVICLQ